MGETEAGLKHITDKSEARLVAKPRLLSELGMAAVLRIDVDDKDVLISMQSRGRRTSG